jgi:hypothetical protein
MSLTIDISGLEGTQLALKKGLAKAVKEIAAATQTALVAKTPVKSGRARSGWTTTVTSTSFTSENRVPYIQRLEDNWSKQTRGRGIIGPALNQVKGKFK